MKRVLLFIVVTVTVNLAIGQETQTIFLKKGWNMVSSYIIPDNTDLDEIFENVPVQVIVSPDGVYLPSHNVKTLQNWNYISAYKIKMNQDAAIQLKGSPVPVNKSVSLTAGINYLPILSQNYVSIDELFGNHIAEVIFIVNLESMELYAPYIGIIGFLEYLSPGKGYLVFMNNPVTVTF